MPSYVYMIWYFTISLIIATATYFALMAVDFSKIFRSNSTWQIKILAILISAALGFSIASGIFDIVRFVKGF